MQRYILERAGQSLVSLLVVVSVVFVLARLTGNPLDLLLDDYASEEQKARMAAELGLDQPWPTQYVIYLGKIVQGDFGRSIRSNRPAMAEVLERVPATLQLGLAGMALTLLVAPVVGVYAAVNRGRSFDTVARLIAMLGHSVPAFWLGIVLIWIFAVHLRLLPTSGQGGLQNLILPAITLAWFSMTGIMRLTRSSMLEVLGTEYVKFARLMGLSETAVIWKHGFKNAALPVVTFAGIVFVSAFLAGSIVVETVFAWPGVARLLLDAVTSRDYPLVQAGVLFVATLYILMNFAVDVLYAYLNPRIRYG
jgi:peptide/nickel transport system permease protein